MRHPNTDDSSLGSMLGGGSALGGDTCDDSTAEHDGDVEDCSDNDQAKKSFHNTGLQFPDLIGHDSPRYNSIKRKPKKIYNFHLFIVNIQ